MKIRLRFLSALLLSLPSLTAFAQQNGSIKGKVTTADGQPAPYITIVIMGKAIGTTTNCKPTKANQFYRKLSL